MNCLAAFDGDLSTMKGRSRTTISVFWQSQMRNLSGRVPGEEAEVLATGSSTVTPLDHIRLCDAD